MKSLNQGVFGLEVLFLLLLAVSFACSQDNDSELPHEDAQPVTEEFNYDKHGADWTGTCAQGKQQSPIDLEDYNTNENSISPVRFSFYDREQKRPITVINNGHTVQMDLVRVPGKPISYVDGGLMPGIYEPISVHFHWGSSTSKGSEHTINNEHFDVEMHIVHKNIDYFDKTVGQASWYSDGLAVLAVMIKAAPTQKDPDSALFKIFDVLPKINAYQSNATIKGDFSLMQLMHHIDTDEFYTYRGSLTTPDCAESVIWTVFKDVIHLPQDEISKLWDLQDSRKLPLVNNYRELQSSNGRRVFYRSQETTTQRAIGPMLGRAFTNVVANVISPLSSYYL